MRTTSTRHRALAVLTALAAAVAATATAAAPAGATSSPERRAAHGGQVRAAAVTDATCPGGTVQEDSAFVEGFEDGLPNWDSTGWVVESEGAAVGSRFASSVAPTDPTAVAEMQVGEYLFAPGRRILTSFLVKGTAGAGAQGQSNLLFWANDEGWSLSDLAADEWLRVTVDVTAATQRGDGWLEIGFDHVQDPALPDTYLAVDDVQVYTCVPAPASGVRGDWTGEGTVDLLAVTDDGELLLYPGGGDGDVDSGVLVGHGWDAMTWMGSPGDVTGDRRSDLVARRSDGILFLYAGRGGGGFGAAVRIGHGWNAMTALTAGGDFSGDGRPDLVARRSDGTLFRYGFTTATRLSTPQRIGWGWNGMTWLVGTDDLNGDRVSDVLAVHSSGDLYAYRGGAAGLRGVGKVGSGWGSMTSVTSPGDLNGDGRGDVVARRSDGALFVYEGKVDGLRPGWRHGDGWSGFVRIL